MHGRFRAVVASPMPARAARIEPTVTPRFTRALLQAAARRDIAVPEALLAELDAGERVSLAAQDRLWGYLCSHDADPLIGLELGLSIQVGHLDTAGMLLMSSNTVGEALDALLEYHPIVGEGGRFDLVRGHATCRLIYEPHYATRCSERVEAVMGCLLALTGWTTGHAFRPDAVTFVHGPLADPARYTQRLGVPVHFNGDANMLAFDTANLALPLSQANPALYAHLQRLAMDELDALGSRSLGARIRHILTGHPDWGRDRVAFELDISPRHLVRRLAAEGESFKQLHDELRRALAERALRDNVRGDAIAERLGFADERAFARAFKRWTGITPARFRAQQAPRTDALLPGR